MQKLALFLNGEKPKNIPDLKPYKEIFCTDGAYTFLRKINIIPDLIIGDFDSIEKLPEDIPHIYTPDQNYTDFAKAIKIIIDKGYKYLDVFAANGLEQDHFLGNMTTALYYKNKINIVFFDDNQTYFFIEKQIKIDNVKGKKISLFPFHKAENIYSKGLKYSLNNMKMSIKNNKIGTRNIASENTVEIKFSKGEILLFIEQ